MYTAYYDLRQEPFHVTPDPDFLFPSPAHKEALAAIIYGIEQRKGFVAITGEVGVGKTTILRSYLDFADRQSLKLIYVYNSNLTFDELVTTILQELGVPDRPPSAFQAVTRLHEELIEVYRRNQTVVLIIDEAQNMPVETLESLRMLSNLETVTEKLIQIMLIGQPELDELLQEHRLRQLRQRIAIHARIGPLNVEDSIAYLEHRLAKVALGTKPVFTANALRLIAESSQGIPRNLNILSDNALITGFGSQVRPVNARIVKEVLDDRGVARPQRGVATWRGAWVGGAAAAAALVIVVALLALQPNILGIGGPADREFARAVAPGATEQISSGSSRRTETPPPGADPAQAPSASGTQNGSLNPAAQSPAESRPAAAPERPIGQPPAPAPRTPDTARAEPQPLPRPPASAAIPPSSSEVARAEPRPSPQAATPPPAPPRPVTAPPIAEPPPRTAEPSRRTRNGAADTGANGSGRASPPAPARRPPPIPLLGPTARAPAAAPPASRPAPSVAAIPPSAQNGAPAPPAAAPSIMMPSASGSGAVASLPQGSEAPQGRTSRAEPFMRTVRAGDSLWTMAEDVYGFVNPNVLRRVQDANPHLRNINVLSPGQEIVFPRVPETSFDRGAIQSETLPARRN
jgi:general secretion pathway protein A